MEGVLNTIGRRKNAVARIYISEGTGQITVNKRDYKTYFPIEKLQYVINQPLNLLEVAGKYDIKANIKGGGFNGQAEALRHAITKALVEINPEDRTALKQEGFLTRDPRKKERKKPGQPSARKQFQFSKR